MEPCTYTMTMRFDGNRSRLRLTREGGSPGAPLVLLRAVMPPPAQFWTGKPAPALLESLSIWLDARLRVVLDVADPADGFCLGLTDELGTGLRTVFYEIVHVNSGSTQGRAAEPGGGRHRLRHRAQRAVSVGPCDFRDVKKPCLSGRPVGGDR